MKCLVVLTAVLGLIVTANDGAQAQVRLQYKFPDGRVSTDEVTVKTDQTLTLGGQELKSGADQTMRIASTNGQRAADGTLRTRIEFKSLKAKVRLPGGHALEFDSATPDADPPGTPFDMLLDVFKATSKMAWTAVYDGQNRVVAIEDPANVLESLPEALQDAVKNQLDPQYLKDQANIELSKIPSDPLSQGDTWDRTETMRLEAGQQLVFTTQYEYKGVVNQNGITLDRIESKTKSVSYSVAGAGPLKVVKSDLKVADSQGFLLFDRGIGQVVQGQHKVHIQGDLTLEVNGTELGGQLDLTMDQGNKRL